MSAQNFGPEPYDPGIPATPEAAIGTGEHKENFGFEQWEFFLSTNAVASMLEKGDRMKDIDYIKELPGRYWMQTTRRPDKNEVLSITLRPTADNRVRILAVIKRGHLEVAKFLRGHQGVALLAEDGMVKGSCLCHKEDFQIPLTSIPEFT